MWGFEHYGMGWGMVLVWLIPIALLAGVLFALRSRGTSAPTTRDILEARYARGEIDRDEYLQKKRDITG